MSRSGNEWVYWRKLFIIIVLGITQAKLTFLSSTKDSKKDNTKDRCLFYFKRKGYRVDTSIYTVLHIFRQVLFWAGNQGNHQNFDPSLLSYKCWLIFIGMKQKFFFWKNEFKMADLNFLFASLPWKSVNIYRLARMGQNFDDYPGFQFKIAYSN